MRDAGLASHVGSEGDAEDVHAESVGHDSLADKGHARIGGSQASEHGNLGASLKARSEKASINALLEVDAVIRGNASGKTAQIGRVDIRHANEGRLDAGKVLVLDKGVRARKVEMVRDQAKAHMGTPCNGARRAGKDDVATT